MRRIITPFAFLSLMLMATTLTEAATPANPDIIMMPNELNPPQARFSYRISANRANEHVFMLHKNQSCDVKLSDMKGTNGAYKCTVLDPKGRIVAADSIASTMIELSFTPKVKGKYRIVIEYTNSRRSGYYSLEVEDETGILKEEPKKHKH